MIKKTIIITGANGGIGKQLAIYFASQKKFNIVLLSQNKNKLNETVRFIMNIYPQTNLKAYCVDLASQNDVKKVFKMIRNDFNSIDILINNAAIAGPVGPIDDINLLNYKKTLDVNLYGSLHCIVESLESMKNDLRGKIINICGAGVGWNATAINKSAYITSKYALYGLNESLSRELKEYNIDINCISPGSYNTNLRDNLVSDIEKNNNTQDLNHVGTTIGSLIDFLISNKADGLTGKIFSAIYDKSDYLLKNIDIIKNSSEYTIRKIDNLNFKRIVSE
ncbi:MAG: SDR family oxidoreductase [Arcobacteraceae bacterium]|nr:SDR family oxidoreductase [Arcobacteraceae bacterium]